MHTSRFASNIRATKTIYQRGDYNDSQLPQIEDKKFISLKTVSALRDAKNLTTVEGTQTLVDALKQDSKGMSFFLETIKSNDRDKPAFERWGSRQKALRQGSPDSTAMGVTTQRSTARTNFNNTPSSKVNVISPLFSGKITDKNEYYKKFIHYQNKFTLRQKPDNYVIYDPKKVETNSEKVARIFKKLEEEEALQKKMSQPDQKVSGNEVD